ncbi:MAG: 4Fe-4S dicluster domain-containing protein [Desulfocucumaceae bacterium]
MDINSELSYLVMSLGLHSFGCAPVPAYGSAPCGHRPDDILPGAKSVVTFTYRLNSGPLDYLPRTRNQYNLEFAVANQILSQAAHKIARLLEDRGHTSIGIGPEADMGDLKRLKADFSHKHSAVICGLGTFGLNNLLLVKKIGPRVRLASVITAAELKYSVPIKESNCLNCGECVSRCPSGALSRWENNYSPETGWVIDKERCAHYIFIVNEGKKCGICVAACPVDK